MSQALVRPSLIAMLLCALVASASAQDYEIKLVRTVKVGDRYGVVATGTTEQHMTMTVAGQPAPPRDQVMAANLTAKAEVLAATPGGRESKSRFTITKLTRTAGPQADEPLPAGTVVVAERVGTKTEFKVGDAPVSPDVAKVLGMLISMESDQGANDDVVFGTKARQKVGDSWPIDANAAAADAAAKAGLKIDPANITGTATLAEVQKEGLKIAGTMQMKDVGIPLPPGMAVTASAFTARFSGVFPLDAAKRAVNSTMSMDGKVECGGKAGDKELTMVMTMKQAKDVTFTAP
jgi:hypothetical protein